MKNHKFFVPLILLTVLLTGCGDGAISEAEAQRTVLNKPAVSEVRDVRDCALRNNGTSVCTVQYVSHRTIMHHYICFEEQPGGWEIRDEVRIDLQTRGDLDC